MQRHTHAVQLRIYVVLTGCRMILFDMQSQRELVTDVSNEMENVFHDREGVCPVETMDYVVQR